MVDRTIQANGLTRRFGDVTVVDAVDLSVTSGSICALLGPNAAGKTTTVRMLTTLLSPTAGTASVAGHDIVREPAGVRSAVGVALQEIGLDPLATATEILVLSAQLNGLGKASKGRADELLEIVGLTAHATKRVGAMSGGMRRRVDLATALTCDPAVLFLDEPTTGLDPISRRDVWEEVQRVNDRGTTVLLTTQYLEEAEVLADTVAIIVDGSIAAEGTPSELKRSAGATTVRIRTTPSSLLTAQAVLNEAGVVDTVIAGDVVSGSLPASSRVERIAAELGRADLDIVELSFAAPTLDDVFISIVGDRHDLASTHRTDPL